MLRAGMYSVSLVLAATGIALAEPAPAPPTPPAVPKELLTKRYVTARIVFEMKLDRFWQARGVPSELFDWSERVVEAGLALADKPADRVKVLRDNLDRARDLERLLWSRAEAGRGGRDDAEAATYFRVEAEIRLLEEGVKPHPPKVEKNPLPKPMPVKEEKPPQKGDREQADKR